MVENECLLKSKTDIIEIIRYAIIKSKLNKDGFKCGLYNSGITAQEKFKNLRDGSVNSYIYYGCTRFYDKACKNTYLREDSLVEQLLVILDRIQIDKIEIKEKLEKEMGRFSNFRNNVLGLTEEQVTDQSGLNLRSYAKYILKEGTVAEKREWPVPQN